MSYGQYTVLPELLTCHSEDPHQPLDTAVPQQSCLHCTVCTFLLLPSGFEGTPDTGSEDQQVEDHHNDNSWDVDCHGGLADCQVAKC